MSWKRKNILEQSQKVNILPFEKYPHRIIMEIVYIAVFWLNCVLHKESIHPTLCPWT